MDQNSGARSAAGSMSKRAGSTTVPWSNNAAGYCRLAPAAFEGARLLCSAPSLTRLSPAQKTAGSTRLDASKPTSKDCGPFQIFSLSSARAPEAADPRKQGRFIGSPAGLLQTWPPSLELVWTGFMMLNIAARELGTVRIPPVRSVTVARFSRRRRLQQACSEIRQLLLSRFPALGKRLSRSQKSARNSAICCAVKKAFPSPYQVFKRARPARASAATDSSLLKTVLTAR